MAAAMANIDTCCTVVAREVSPVLFGRKAAFQVGKYRSHTQPRRLRRSDDTEKEREKGDKARVTIRDLHPEEKRRIASLIQELARSTEEREIAVDRLQQAHAALQQQKEELGCLRKEREQLVAQTADCQLLAKEYQKQVVAQEATLVQLQQAGVFDRKDTEHQHAMMVSSGIECPRADEEGMISKVKDGSLLGRDTNMPHQLISESQTQLYTLQQEMECMGQMPGNSNKLPLKHGLSGPLYDSITLLHGEKTSASLLMSSEKPINKSDSEMSSGKTNSKSVSDVGVGPSDPPDLHCMKHKAIQTSPQKHISHMSRGCQTTPSIVKEQMYVCDCEPKTVHQPLQLTECVCAVTGVDVGIQTEHCLYVCESHEAEQTCHSILSSFMCSHQAEEQDNRGDKPKLFPVACEQNMSISLSLLELIDDLELTNTDSYVKESNPLLTMDSLESEHENTVLSDIFFLS